jgi:hypothetical protein
MKLIVAISALLWLSVGLTQSDSEIIKSHSFKGKIIRSFAVNPENKNQILLGLKGSNPGDGKVFLSNDAGMNWEPLNKDKALCDSCLDVQTVCFLDDETYLAGTWKNGLYLTTNAGKKFVKIKNFPSSDIRSVVKAPGGTVYAATTTHGIMRTDDKGKTWNAPHSSDLNTTLASWKIALAPGANLILYAMTFGNGIYKTMDGGKTWKQTVHEDEVMIWDIAFIKNELYAVGGNEKENFLFHSYLGEKKWKMYKLNMFGNINSLHIVETFLDYKVFLGTWGNGIQSTFAIEYSNNGYRCVEFIKDDTIGVTDMYSTPDFIYNFSWGDGLKIIEREKECAILVTKSIPSNTNKESPQSSKIESSCELDYIYFKFYDRWGSLIYETQSSLDSVNHFLNSGTDSLANDEYIYWMKSSFTNNQDTTNLKGHIQIVR